MRLQFLARILSRARASRNPRQAAINIGLATLRRFGDRFRRVSSGGLPKAAHLPVNFQLRSAATIKQDLAYAIQVTDNHLRRCRELGLDLDGARLLELGPGVNFGPQLILASHGAEVVLVDRYLSAWQAGYHPAFYAALATAWAGPKAGLERVIAQDGYEGVLTLVDEPAESITSIVDACMDLVISNAVLEHVYDLPAVAAELSRVTRPGGLGVHQIDFRDHADFSRPLEFLLEDQETYARIFEEIHGDRGNRLRPDEAARAFESAGFEILAREVNEAVDEAYLQDFLPRLRASPSPYAAYEVEALRPLGVCLTMRRR